MQDSTFHHLFQGMDIASNFSADVDYVIVNNTITFTARSRRHPPRVVFDGAIVPDGPDSGQHHRHVRGGTVVLDLIDHVVGELEVEIAVPGIRDNVGAGSPHDICLEARNNDSFRLFNPADGGTRVRTVASVVNFTSVPSCTTPATVP